MVVVGLNTSTHIVLQPLVESHGRRGKRGGLDITLQFRDGEKIKNPNFSAVFLHNYSLLRVWGEGVI